MIFRRGEPHSQISVPEETHFSFSPQRDLPLSIGVSLSIYVLFEVLAFVAININLVTCFNGIMHMNLSDAATTLTNFSGTSFSTG